MKAMNLDSFQHETEMMIVKATLTIIDRRTGEVENRDFYRFGQRFPIEQVGKQLSEYGYDVLGYTDATYTEGIIDFEMLFAGLEAVNALAAEEK